MSVEGRRRPDELGLSHAPTPLGQETEVPTLGWAGTFTTIPNTRGSLSPK